MNHDRNTTFVRVKAFSLPAYEMVEELSAVLWSLEGVLQVAPNLTYPRQTMTIVKMGIFLIHGIGIPGYEVNESREELDS